MAVTVPATSANLGPGFDCLGLALGLRDRLVGKVTDSGLVVEVEGEGAADVDRGEQHLVVRAMRAGFDALGGQPAGLRLHCDNAIPHARGLGSSSAAIVGGLALARALVPDGDVRLDDDALLGLAADLEGHPDNVAPALLGGLVVAGRDPATATGWFAVRSDVDPRVSAVALVPPDGVRTDVARGLLPAQVSHADAAANAGRAALLALALTSRPEQLLRGTADRLHQDHRRPAMPDSLDLVHALRERGVPAVISGAGPTVLALQVDGAATGGDVRHACPPGWSARALRVEPQGVVVDATVRSSR